MLLEFIKITCEYIGIFISNNIGPVKQFLLPSFSFCLTMLSILIAIIAVVIVILRTIYKIGFFGKMNFHTYYDFIDYFKKDGIIYDDEPKWNKYCNIDNVRIIDTEANNSSNNTDVLSKIHRFIDTNAKGLKCLTSNNVSTYLSAYENNTNYIEYLLCSSRATMKISVSVKNKNVKQNILFDVIPIHELTIVKQNIDNKHNDEKFQFNFATLYYFQNSNTPGIYVSVFKYNKIWNVKPLCNLFEVVFKIDKSLDYNFAQKKALSFFTAKNENMTAIFDFLDTNMKTFDVVITTEISRLLNLVLCQMYIIVGCVLLGKTIGVLFFKKTVRDFTKDPVLELQASVFNDTVTGKLRQACFSRGVIIANKVVKSSFVVINDTSHNNSILNMIIANVKPCYYSCVSNVNEKFKHIINNANISKINETAYYLNNYRTNTREASKCLIIT